MKKEDIFLLLTNYRLSVHIVCVSLNIYSFPSCSLVSNPRRNKRKYREILASSLFPLPPMEIIPDISTNLSPTKSFSTFRNSKLSTNKRGRSTKVLINPNNLSLSLFFKMNIALLQLNEKTKRCSIDFLTSKCSCSCVCHQTKSICVRMFTSATERSRLKLISVCFSLFLHRVSK